MERGAQDWGLGRDWEQLLDVPGSNQALEPPKTRENEDSESRGRREKTNPRARAGSGSRSGRQWVVLLILLRLLSV